MKKNYKKLSRNRGTVQSSSPVEQLPTEEVSCFTNFRSGFDGNPFAPYEDVSPINLSIDSFTRKVLEIFNIIWPWLNSEGPCILYYWSCYWMARLALNARDPLFSFYTVNIPCSCFSCRLLRPKDKLVKINLQFLTNTAESPRLLLHEGTEIQTQRIHL